MCARVMVSWPESVLQIESIGGGGGQGEHFPSFPLQAASVTLVALQAIVF